jgi:hypothetical protein
MYILRDRFLSECLGGAGGQGEFGSEFVQEMLLYGECSTGDLNDLRGLTFFVREILLEEGGVNSGAHEDDFDGIPLGLPVREKSFENYE